MSISIIIPTLNHLSDALKPCLDSIIKYTNLDNIEVIVVSNGSTDGTQEYVKSLGDKFILLDYPEALGYTKATNEGIKVAKGDFLILLNNDTVLLPQETNEWVDKLIHPFDDENVGITGPMKAHCPYANRHFLIFFCVMIRRTMFDKLGLLDELFSPGFGEDTDFCIKLQDAGYGMMQVPEESNLYYDTNRMVGNFPIYHEGEVTFTDEVGGSALLKKNREILKERYNIKKIAIVMPVYNSKEYLLKTINSIINQTYKNWVLYIIDDASTDGTPKVIPDHRQIRVIYSPVNGGPSHARNLAIADIITDDTIDYVAYCDSDDMWHENHIMNNIPYLSNVDMVYSDADVVFANGDVAIPFGVPYHDDFSVEKLHEGNFIYITNAIHKKHCFDVGVFDSSLDSIEDYDLWLRVADAGYTILHNKQTTTTIVKRGDGVGSWRKPSINKLFKKKRRNRLLKKQHNEVYKEIFETNTYSILEEDVKGKTVIDVGAFRGFFSILCSDYEAKAIYAIEANPDTFPKLMENIADIDITAFNVALHSTDDDTVYLESDGPRSKVRHNGTAVKTISLTTFLDNVGVTDTDMVLKMDIEGSEFDILLNTKDEVIKRFETIFIETHYDMNINPEYRDRQLLVDLFKRCGFKQVHNYKEWVWDVGPNGEQLNKREVPTATEKWIRK